MRKLSLAVAAGLMASTAQAQPISPSPETSLQCAAWAAMVAGLNEDRPEIVQGFTLALTWFTAHYEGLTGRPFEQALTADYLSKLGPRMDAVEKTCLPLMEAMGSRMAAWSEVLLASDAKAQED